MIGPVTWMLLAAVTVGAAIYLLRRRSRRYRGNPMVNLPIDEAPAGMSRAPAQLGVAITGDTGGIASGGGCGGDGGSCG